jgi:serine/threonine protein kinase
MEYIDGPTVGELLKRGGALDEKRAINIVTQISRALQHAFNHGIIHRDIKPDNIMLTREGVAKLCDLGLAKLQTKDDGDASGTAPGASMGTPYYIAPEQARGEQNVDTRADIYSLGASFYHMVAGEVPFVGQSAADVISKHLTEPGDAAAREEPARQRRRRLGHREDDAEGPRGPLPDAHRARARPRGDRGGRRARGLRPGIPGQVVAIPKLRRGRLLRRTGRFRRR